MKTTKQQQKLPRTAEAHRFLSNRKTIDRVFAMARNSEVPPPRIELTREEIDSVIDTLAQGIECDIGFCGQRPHSLQKYAEAILRRWGEKAPTYVADRAHLEEGVQFYRAEVAANELEAQIIRKLLAMRRAARGEKAA